MKRAFLFYAISFKPFPTGVEGSRSSTQQSKDSLFILADYPSIKRKKFKIQQDFLSTFPFQFSRNRFKRNKEMHLGKRDPKQRRFYKELSTSQRHFHSLSLSLLLCHSFTHQLQDKKIKKMKEGGPARAGHLSSTNASTKKNKRSPTFKSQVKGNFDRIVLRKGSQVGSKIVRDSFICASMRAFLSGIAGREAD